MNRCPKCGGKLRVLHTWLKNNTRKRVRICEQCKSTITTTEIPDPFQQNDRENEEKSKKFRDDF